METLEKSLKGKIFHRIETLGGKEYEHIGFEDDEKQFGDILASFVPEIGMEKKVEITFRLLDEE